MKRRTLLSKTLNRLTAGVVASIVFNPFETARAVGSFYSNAVTEAPTAADERSGVASRRATGDRYRMTYEWPGAGAHRWRLQVSVARAAYRAAAKRSRGYLGAFEAARRSRHARRLAGRLEAAEPVFPSGDRSFPGTGGGGLTDRERLDRAVGFARGLSYAVDPESKGVPEYHRTVEETLVDGRGDCKDLTYLLAGILSHPPFGYRVAMVFLPEHMLLGVHRSELPGAYADAPTLPGCEYVAVESTAADPIGEFRDKPVLAVYDDGIEHVDRSATLGTTAEFARDPTEFQFVANMRE